jgi:2-haloacid dehalogenase
MRRHADFWQVTQDALDYALDTFGLRDEILRRALMDAYLHLDCYPEVPAMLNALKRAHMPTAILSNGSPAMLNAAVENSGLADLIDVTLSIEEVGVYKPDPRVYQLAVERLGIPASALSFQSANAWDAAGAASFGLRVVWVNRFGQRRERLPFEPEAEIASLSELPGRLGLL